THLRGRGATGVDERDRREHRLPASPPRSAFGVAALLVALVDVAVDQPGRPTSTSRPASSQATVSHSVRMVPIAWLTTTTVLPARRNSANFSMHFSWKAASPTASTSSTSRISGSTLMATENPRRTYMPDE